MYKISIEPRELVFKRPAGTSRGVYNVRHIWYVVVEDECGHRGVGECAPLLNLSCDHESDNQYTALLNAIAREEEAKGVLAGQTRYFEYPSIDFGLQTAFRNLKVGSWALEDTPFSRGKEGIQINGLVWMGSYEYMFEQIKSKIEQGFRCIKLKIGAIDFEEEYSLLKYIRTEFTKDDIQLRVDANGAFNPSEALRKLERLAVLDIHSIEQPIRAGQWEEMARLTEQTPLPIALDEELIGINTSQERKRLLTEVRPQYIILKPSLHSNIDEWVDIAENGGIGWWATSALESNIGLNAIAQWAGKKNVCLPQGLGTGQLFETNIDAPIYLRGDEIWFSPADEDVVV